MSLSSFSAICSTNTRTVILGTMPGKASLQAHEYYAHKRNALWPIVIAHITNTPVDLLLHGQYSYEEKTTLLQDAGFGLWDVLAECERPGSLDSAIKKDSIVVNDFALLFSNCPNLTKLIFNGKTAASLFYKYVKPQLQQQGAVVNETSIITANAKTITLWTMPSTSPAMASLDLHAKHTQWKVALDGN